MFIKEKKYRFVRKSQRSVNITEAIFDRIFKLSNCHRAARGCVNRSQKTKTKKKNKEKKDKKEEH